MFEQGVIMVEVKKTITVVNGLACSSHSLCHPSEAQTDNLDRNCAPSAMGVYTPNGKCGRMASQLFHVLIRSFYLCLCLFLLFG